MSQMERDGIEYDPLFPLAKLSGREDAQCGDSSIAKAMALSDSLPDPRRPTNQTPGSIGMVNDRPRCVDKAMVPSDSLSGLRSKSTFTINADYRPYPGIRGCQSYADEEVLSNMVQSRGFSDGV